MFTESESFFFKFKPFLVVNLALPYQDLNIMDACLITKTHYLDTANYEPKDEAKFVPEYSDETFIFISNFYEKCSQVISQTVPSDNAPRPFFDFPIVPTPVPSKLFKSQSSDEVAKSTTYSSVSDFDPDDPVARMVHFPA